MHASKTKGWKFAIWGALAVTLLSLYPQLLMWGVRGRQWNGAYAEFHGDESVYSAYVQALIDGRPRRNDPYTGRDDRPGQPQPESLFSIQFVPAYLIAMPARLLGISSSTAFIALAFLVPFFSCLAIFCLIANLTQDHRLAAAGSIMVLCFGGLAAGVGIVQVFSSGLSYSFLPFLRRFDPALPFPLFFLFCTFVWKSLSTDGRADFGWAVAAGLTLSILIFSYFFLWTSALAWLVCLAFLWFVARPGQWRRYAGRFGTIGLLTVAALVPYAILLARRSPTMDKGQKLTISHAPDLFRIPELLGFAVIAVIIWGVVRGRINWRAPVSLFAGSFALMPFVVFNQQVISGYSLQPFHYEAFIANYLALVGAVVVGVILWRGPESEQRPIRYRVAARVVFVAFWWAAIEVLAPTNVIIKDSQFTDRAAGVGRRLRQLSNTDGLIATTSQGTNPRPLVLARDTKLSLILPTFAPLAVFWAPNFDFLNLEPGESSERFYEYLYYTGTDSNQLMKELGQPMSVLTAAAFGHERVIPDLSVQPQPITSEEIARKVADYQAYVASFTRERASRHILSFVIAPGDGGLDLSNLDRWYQRDQGEQVGNYILYRVQLRP
ncbi:MAG: hypothetical protein ND866_07760 [Pyrinomonadaceae bacterium]|nr:hypothetical protein [Pyrinomonadaceae bacterium]